MTSRRLWGTEAEGLVPTEEEDSGSRQRLDTPGDYYIVAWGIKDFPKKFSVKQRRYVIGVFLIKISFFFFFFSVNTLFAEPWYFIYD